MIFKPNNNVRTKILKRLQGLLLIIALMGGRYLQSRPWENSFCDSTGRNAEVEEESLDPAILAGT
jgi:hypothetical protein